MNRVIKSALLAGAAQALRPGGRGTLVDFTGDFSIKVPFLGGKLEAQAAPALLEGFAVQQKVGDEWLATRNAESA